MAESILTTNRAERKLVKKIHLLFLICLTAALLGAIPGAAWAFDGADGGQDDGGSDDDGENDNDEGDRHNGHGHHGEGHHAPMALDQVQDGVMVRGITMVSALVDWVDMGSCRLFIRSLITPIPPWLSSAFRRLCMLSNKIPPNPLPSHKPTIGIIAGQQKAIIRRSRNALMAGSKWPHNPKTPIWSNL